MQQATAATRADEARAAHIASGAELAEAAGVVFRISLTVLLLALLVRTVLVQPFSIPSRSMAPGLEAGDYILVDKAAYGWGQAALPLQPEARLLPGEPLLGVESEWLASLRAALPERVLAKPPVAGDVIVFAGPAAGARQDYVKRVIATGGERVALTAGQVWLNGRAVPCVPVGRGLCEEQLPSGARYLVRSKAGGSLADFAEIVVPEGHCFVLGDNRNDSADSRLAVADGGVGLVPERLLVGRARVIFLSLADGRLRFDRIGLAAR